MVSINNLTVDVLHDIEDEYDFLYSFSRWRCSVDTDGRITWGGRGNLLRTSRLVPAVRLSPPFANEESIATIVRMEKRIADAVRYGRWIPKHPRFPALWAGYKPREAPSLSFSGHEYESFRDRLGWPDEVLESLYFKEHSGLRLVPAAWVAPLLTQATDIFADFEKFPRRQLLRMSSESDLMGATNSIVWHFAARSVAGMDCHMVA